MKFVVALSYLAAAAFFSDGDDWPFPRVATAAHVRLGSGDKDGADARSSRRHRSLASEEPRRDQGLGNFADPKTVAHREVVWNTSEDGDEEVVPIEQPEIVAPRPEIKEQVLPVIHPYSIENVLLTLPFFGAKFFVFLYVAERDEFVALYDVDNLGWKWRRGDARIRTDGSVLALALRNNFPDRFQGPGESSDLAFLVSVGDSVQFEYPECVDPENRDQCRVDHYAPIFVFGSAFTDQSVLPSQIAMPMPKKPHMPCFALWQMTRTVCQDIQPRDGDSGVGLIFEEHVGVGWDDLIPTIIWRGADHSFLYQIYKDFRSPDYGRDVEPKIIEYGEEPIGIISALYEKWDILRPRWKGVLLTAEAELEASEREGEIPWADIKFSACIVGGKGKKKSRCSESTYYQEWANRGITAFGEPINMEGHAKYKYHIDLGDQGGTTWTGTINKLSMPGVLFHHITPTKDWIHDYLEPWVHYIPVATDLSDLRERFQWAEANPVEARKISDNATAFARWIGTSDGFEELYHRYFVENLAAVIDAYRPPEVVFGGKGAAGGVGLPVLPAISYSHNNLKEVMRCTGHERWCEWVGRAAKDKEEEENVE